MRLGLEFGFVDGDFPDISQQIPRQVHDGAVLAVDGGPEVFGGAQAEPEDGQERRPKFLVLDDGPGFQDGRGAP